MRLLKASKSLIGIDITSSSVKLLELRKSRDIYQVESYAIRKLQEGAVIEGRLQNVDEVAYTLKQALAEARPSTRKAAVAIPASVAITKMLYFPAALSEEEVEERLMVESDHHLPGAFNEMAFDFHTLGPAPSAPHLQQVLLVACRQLDSWHWLEALEQAGLEPVAVDMETFAIERAFAALSAGLPQHLEGNGIGLVDIGAVATSFHVIQKARVIYTHDSPVGGEQLTQAIQVRYALPKAEAEQAKKEGGLPDDFHRSVLTPFLETVAQQVAHALKLYYSQGRSIDVTRLVLIGGACRTPGLATQIEAACGIPVTQGNPLAPMQCNKRLDGQVLAGDSPALFTASGLAMRVGA